MYFQKFGRRIGAFAVTVDGGGHTWPGSALITDPQMVAVVGQAAQNLDASAEILRFADPLADAAARRR